MLRERCSLLPGASSHHATPRVMPRGVMPRPPGGVNSCSRTEWPQPELAEEAEVLRSLRTGGGGGGASPLLW